MKIPYTASSPDPEVAIVLKVGRKYGIDEAMIIYTSKIDVMDWVTLRCKYGCENYSKCYSCPPNSVAPEKMRKILKEYKRGILVASKTKDLDAQRQFRAALIEMERELFLTKYYKAFALVPCACNTCDKCAVHDGKGCRNPNDSRPCIEGTGIDVFNLVSKYKKSLKPITDKEKPFESYGVILLD